MQGGGGRLEERLVHLKKEKFPPFRSNDLYGIQSLTKQLPIENMRDRDLINKSGENTVKIKIRARNGKKIKVIHISKEDYEEMKIGHKDAGRLLRKYLTSDKVETNEPTYMHPMKVQSQERTFITKDGTLKNDTSECDPGLESRDFSQSRLVENDRHTCLPLGKKSLVGLKATIRTKASQIIQKSALLTRGEYEDFQNGGRNKNFLKILLELDRGDDITAGEKASTEYSISEDEIYQKGR